MTKRFLLSERYITDLHKYLRNIYANLYETNLTIYDLGKSDNIDVQLLRLLKAIETLEKIPKVSVPFEYI